MNAALPPNLRPAVRVRGLAGRGATARVPSDRVPDAGSLWDDWTPGDEGEVPTAPAAPVPAPPLEDAPETPRRRPSVRVPPGEPVADEDAPAYPDPGPLPWALGIAGLAFAMTITLGVLLAVVSKDAWLLGVVGEDAGLGTEAARQAIEVPFGGLRFRDGTEPFVYGLVLPAALVAATSAYAARHFPTPATGVRARRVWALAAAIPYAGCMAVVAAIAVTGDVSSASGGRLLLWSVLLVGVPAALGAAPLAPTRLSPYLRALFVPAAAAWAFLTVALTIWALALTLTQQNARLGYDLDQSLRQVPVVEELRDYDLSPVPALAVLALVPANLGLEGLMNGFLAEQRGDAPLGATDRRIDESSDSERRRFIRCALGDEDACRDVRVLDAPDQLPPLFGWFLTLVVIGTALTAATVAGSRLAALAPRAELRGAFGALTGPVYAVALLVVDGATDSLHDGWSVFTGTLLLATVAGFAGATWPREQAGQSIADQT